MTDHYDALETRKSDDREADLFARLPGVLRTAMEAPAYAERLRGIDPATVTSRAALADLPVLRKSDLPALHKAALPFGGLVTAPLGSFGRLFTSPGPIFEPQATETDSWGSARALFAAGLRPGDVVISANQRTVSTPAELAQIVAEAKTAKRATVFLLVSRGGQTAPVVLKLEK